MNIKQIMQFCFVGGVGVAINSAMLFVLVEYFGGDYMAANICGIVCASVWNYCMYKWWVFG